MTMPLVWLLPMLQTSSGRWVESEGAVNSLSPDDDLLLIRPVNSDLSLLTTRGVLEGDWAAVEEEGVSSEDLRSQSSTLADWFW